MKAMINSAKGQSIYCTQKSFIIKNLTKLLEKEKNTATSAWDFIVEGWQHDLAVSSTQGEDALTRQMAR